MEYKDYITCFANRSKKVLDKFSVCDPDNELNVTALLSVATSAFMIPFERLNTEHPFGDSATFEKIVSKVDDEKKKKIVNHSKLFCGDSWKIYRETDSNTLEEKHFDDVNYKAIASLNDIEANEIISTIRNALAHGNINTGVSGNTIDKLYFLSRNNKKKCIEEIYAESNTCSNLKDFKAIIKKIEECKKNPKNYKIVQCSIHDFRSFLDHWIDLLSCSNETFERNC
jgi:hypothetical protein